MHEFPYMCRVCGEEFIELARIGQAEKNPPCPNPACTGTGERVYEMPDVVFGYYNDPRAIMAGIILGIETNL